MFYTMLLNMIMLWTQYKYNMLKIIFHIWTALLQAEEPWVAICDSHCQTFWNFLFWIWSFFLKRRFEKVFHQFGKFFPSLERIWEVSQQTAVDIICTHMYPRLHFSGRRVLSASNVPAPYNQIASPWKRLHSLYWSPVIRPTSRLAGNN